MQDQLERIKSELLRYLSSSTIYMDDKAASLLALVVGVNPLLTTHSAWNVKPLFGKETNMYSL